MRKGLNISRRILLFRRLRKTLTAQCKVCHLLILHAHISAVAADSVRIKLSPFDKSESLDAHQRGGCRGCGSLADTREMLTHQWQADRSAVLPHLMTCGCSGSCCPSATAGCRSALTSLHVSGILVSILVPEFTCMTSAYAFIRRSGCM